MRVAGKIGRPLWIVFSFIAVYAAIFSFVTVSDYLNFMYHDWDLAIYNQFFHGLLSGHPVSSLMDVAWFGNHVEATSLILFPFYALVPGPSTLLVAQALMLGLAAWPLYLIAKTLLNESWGILFAVLYLLYPPVGFVNLNEFHPESFLPFLQFFLFYFFLKDNFRYFCIFLAACLLAKENMPLMMIAFGFYAFWKKRSPRWGLVPILAGAAWFAICLYGIKPFLTQGKIGFYESYAHLGHSLPEIAGSFLTHPKVILACLLMPGKMLYLAQLLLPLALLPLCGFPVLAITFPNLLQHFLSLRPEEFSLLYYYPAEFFAFFFIAAAAGVQGLLGRFSRLQHYERKMRFALLAIMMFFAVQWGTQLFVVKGLFISREKKEATRIKNGLISEIPDGASVMASFAYLPKLSRKTDRLYSFHQVFTGTYQLTDLAFSFPAHLTYALVDFDFIYPLAEYWTKKGMGARKFFENGNWGVVDASGNSVLFKKGASADSALCREVDPASLSGMREIIFNGDLKLRVASFQELTMARGGKMPLAFVWESLSELKHNYMCEGVFVDAAGKHFYGVMDHPVTYGFYRPNSWPAGVAVREKVWVPITPKVLKGTYSFYILIYDFFTGDKARVALDADGEKSGSASGLVYLGRVTIK